MDQSTQYAHQNASIFVLYLSLYLGKLLRLFGFGLIVGL